MSYFLYVSYIAFLFCLGFCLKHFFYLIKLGVPKDLSQKAGNISAGIIYANTTAMLPTQKESAYKHLPTYSAGILFHIGSFMALFGFIILFFNAVWNFFIQHTILSILISIYLWISVGCGTGLIIKRIVSKKLRPISNLDDYISTFLVTLFQFFSALLFTIFSFHEFFYKFFSFELYNLIIIIYFFISSLLFLYLPFGKLKHVVYYFAARYHLGFFYGRRGTWPPKFKL